MEGVDVVVPLGVFGGSVVRRRWMSYSPHSALPVAVDGGFQIQHTPLTSFVPILVTNPLTLSDRSDESTRVEPGSFVANKAAHSSRPSLRAPSECWRDFSSHCSSSFCCPKRQYNIHSTGIVSHRTKESSSALRSSSGGMGG